MSQPKKTLKQRFAAMFGKRFRAAAIRRAASAIVIAIAVLVNLMVGKPAHNPNANRPDGSVPFTAFLTKPSALPLPWTRMSQCT